MKVDGASLEYADDCSSLMAAKTITELQVSLNILMEEYLSYFSCNGLAINISKTNIICFSSDPEDRLTYDGQLDKKTCKLLGINFDKSYNFNYHRVKITFGVLEKIKKLDKISRWMSRPMKKEMYTSFCLSVIYYNLDIYGRTDQVRKKLQVLMNKVLRKILDASRYEKITNMLKSLEMLSINNNYRYLQIMNMQKLLDKENSPFTFYCLDLEERLVKTRNRFLRSTFSPKLESVKNSWLMRAMDWWNKLQLFKVKFAKSDEAKAEVKGKILTAWPNIDGDKID